MPRFPAALLFLTVVSAHSQVIDVNGDSIVGPHEALAVSEQWKGTATRANDHNHLGQTWTGDNNPLTIRGDFPGGPIFQLKDKQVLPIPNAAPAPMVLDNEATPSGNGFPPDLILGGSIGVLSARESSSSEMVIEANRRVFVHVDLDNSGSGPDDGQFVVLNGENDQVLIVAGNGDMFLDGAVTENLGKIRMVHPLDPENKDLFHASVGSPEMKNIYDGITTLDTQGESDVKLPEYFEGLNSEFRYQLTPIGGPMPNLHIAEEIQGNQFRIAGGTPGLKVSWTVTGTRKDAYAKSHPFEVEKAKKKD